MPTSPPNRQPERPRADEVLRLAPLEADQESLKEQEPMPLTIKEIFSEYKSRFPQNTATDFVNLYQLLTAPQQETVKVYMKTALVTFYQSQVDRTNVTVSGAQTKIDEIQAS